MKLVFCPEEAEQFLDWLPAVQTDWTSTDQCKLDPYLAVQTGPVRPGDPSSPAQTFFFKIFKVGEVSDQLLVLQGDLRLRNGLVSTGSSTDQFRPVQLGHSPLAPAGLVLLDRVAKLALLGAGEDLEVLGVKVEAQMKI